jgi:glycosyltransferase involved in cell wall biosynthesis
MPPAAPRVLVVSYNFPPVGGVGVARMAKLVKYLPAFGVVPSVLTVRNPSVPLRDHSLERDLPRELEVVRAPSLEPGYGWKRRVWQAAAAQQAGGRRAGIASRLARELLIPDPQVLWQPGAWRALAERLARRRDDAVLISGPPFSQFLLAALTRLRRGTAVVLDYRDEWSTYRAAYEMMGRATARVGSALERTLLRCAHAVTTATSAFRDQLLARFSFLDPAVVRVIPNGYDPDDFPRALPRPEGDRLLLTYAGTVFRLTSPRGLLGALRRLREREPAIADGLRVRFVGRVVETEAAAFGDANRLGIERIDYVPHADVLPMLARSHRVLCLLDEVAGAERIYPAKIFELAYLGRPALVLAPPGALTELCLRHRLGEVLPPRDEAAIAALLARWVRDLRAGNLELDTRAIDLERYHRRALAGEFAQVLGDAIDRARGAA